MADSGRGSGCNEDSQVPNPFKLATGPPSSTSLVFSSGNKSRPSTQSSDHQNYMLFGGISGSARTSTSSSSNIFGLSSPSSSSVVASVSSSLFRPRMSLSSSSGQGKSHGTNVSMLPGSGSFEKSQFGGVTTVFSSATSGSPASSVFREQASLASAAQLNFSVQTPSSFSSGSPSTALIFGSKSPSLPTRSFGDAKSVSGPPNIFSVPNSGQESKTTFSIKPNPADPVVFSNSSNIKDVKQSPTPLLFGGVTGTSHCQVSALNVFGGTSAPQLFQGMKDTSLAKGTAQSKVQITAKSASEEIDAIFSTETLSEKANDATCSEQNLFNKPETSDSGSSPPFDKKEITKIIIAQIPDSCMDKEVLRNHFMKFGAVKRVTLSPKANQATVQYADHHSASKAKKKGKKIHPKLPEVKIFYGTPVRRRSEDESAIQSKKKAIRTLQLAQAPNDLEPYEPIPRPAIETTELPKSVQSKTGQPKRSHVSDEKKSEKKKKIQSRGGAAGKEKKEPSIASDGKDPKEILQSKCNTSHDKYFVLVARDNLVRKVVIRTSDIEKATYLSATCPDMCPEKERYMRDVQNDLSSYEMKNGVIDHSLVVKKFSRSSADKDEPLPYELRPGPVLLKTMDFLICNIIDRGDDEGVEMDVWYNYLWNRTRAIRNDLMQQQLTDEVAVNIMERCMRFHIHCAARFCHESPDFIDAKMNTEHLTKSLQTLKELYKDLGERGEYFSTESEFRAYELLLNLNQGETLMTQYSQYREEVQKSKEVQFALKVGMAVMFNNYIKFFKLIRSATYLQACMMHRYFRQVRLKALDTIMKAYVPPKQTQTLPLETVIKTLGFEDESDAENYLQIYGIKVIEKNVILDKSLFTTHSEELPPVVRPIKLVESNRNCSIGEVIQGGPLPENPLLTYVPHNSFDSQGYLKHEAINASDQQTHKKFSASETKEIPSQQSQQLSIHEMMAYTFNLIKTSVFKEEIIQVCKEAVDECRVEYAKGAKSVASELLKNCLEKEIANISKIAIQEIKYEEEEKLRKKLEEEKRVRVLKELTDKVVQLLCTEYLNEFVDMSVRDLCIEAIHEVEKQTWEAVIKELLIELPSVLSREVVSSEVEKLSTEVLCEMRDELEAKINSLQEKISSRKMQDYFRRWRVQVLRVKRRKQAQETFPACGSQLSVKQQNELFGWGYQRSKEDNISAFKVSTFEMFVSKNIEELTARNQLVKTSAWHKLPLQKEMKKEVDGSLQAANVIRQYFKVLICVLENTNSVIIHWLRSKLSVEEENLHQELDSFFSFISKNAGLEYACLLTEVSINNLTYEDIKGVSALIFVVPSQLRKQEPNSQVLHLLHNVSHVPKLTIQYDEESSDSLAEGILDSPIWNLVECDLYYPETSQKLLSHIVKLWKQQDECLQVVSNSLNNFVYGFIAKRVVETFMYKNHERMEDGKSPLYPEAYIKLYNDAMNHLTSVVEDEELKKLDWPAPRMSHLEQVPPASWNNSNVEVIGTLLRQLKLPELKLENIMSHATLRKCLHEYAMTISNEDNSSIVLISHLDVLLSNSIMVVNKSTTAEDADSRNCKVHILQWPWTEIIKACIYHKLTGIPDLPVYYQPRKLNSFKYPHSWWDACDSCDLHWAETVHEYQQISRKRKPCQLPGTRVSQKKKPSRLLTDIAKEKSKYIEFEQRLQKILNSE